MSSYLGRHAEFYDTFYANKPYEEEAAFVDTCLRELAFENRPRRLLEMACGTGRHALAFQNLGYQVVGLDYSQDMIRCARKRAAAHSSPAQFHHADMRSFDFSHDPFDAAVCLFDSIGYVGSNEDVIRVLKNVHRHLQNGGLFVFEFWHAAAMLRDYDPVRVRRWETPRGQLVRISETSLDCVRQVCNVKYTIHELNHDGHCFTISETQSNRFFLLQEMTLLVELGGFKPLKWFTGFRADEQISEHSWHIVAVVQKQAADSMQDAA